MDADVVEAHLVQVHGSCRRTDVTLTSVGRKGHGVLQVTPGQVVADGTVHVVLRRV